MAGLLIEVLRSCVREARIIVHEFVVMPNHLHVLMTLPAEISVEKAMQLIKGRFSFRAGRELGFKGEIWQRGFSDVRVWNKESFFQHRAYIEQNPIRDGLAIAADEFRFGSAYLKKQKRTGAEARLKLNDDRHD